MAEAVKPGEQLQKQSLALLKKQSGADQRQFCDVSPCIGGPAHQTNDTSRSVGALNTAAQDNRRLICIASEITEKAINIAGLEAKKYSRRRHGGPSQHSFSGPGSDEHR